MPPVPEFTPEDVEALRQAWLTAEEKLSKAPDNEHFEKAQQKAWFAYMATKSDGVPRVPSDLMSKKARSGFLLLCAKRHVLETPVEAAVFSYQVQRDMRAMRAGDYDPKDIYVNSIGETVAVFSEEIIVATHWGPTPFARALQLREPEPDPGVQ